jgi:TonB family protein
MRTLSKMLLFSAMACTTIEAGAQVKPSDPVSQNATEAPPASSTSPHRPDVGSCVLIRAVNPKFPPQASPKKKRGDIILHATVAADGIVKGVTVVSGDPVLVGPAIEAARQYQFAPCIQDGSPVESQTTITVSYDLRRDTSYPADASSTVPREPQEDVVQEVERRELFQLRDGVTFSKALYRPNPEYSEAARKAKLQGGVVLGVVVGTDGKPRSVWVVKTLGEGLDENTVEAVRRWTFTPATKDGKPVPVLINLVMIFP